MEVVAWKECVRMIQRWSTPFTTQSYLGKKLTSIVTILSSGSMASTTVYRSVAQKKHHYSNEFALLGS